jgi:hypothetical protein
MNLVKLLAAGKSIMNDRGGISYRANKNVYLPKFGSVQNSTRPFAGTEPAETAAAPAKKTTPFAAKTQKIPPWPTPGPTPGPARATSWASKLNPVSIWRDARPAETKPPPVQSELSLDSVKVVHNDLSDADVEVVPMKSRTADAPAVPTLSPPTRSWEFLAERMFHTTAD